MSDKVESIEYSSINRIVDIDGVGVAIYGDIFDFQTRKTLSGPETYRYISSSVVNYEEIVKAMIHVTGLSLELNDEKRKAEMQKCLRQEKL